MAEDNTLGKSKPQSPRPLSIKLIALFYFFSGLVGISVTLLDPPLSGGLVILERLISVCVDAYLALGLWRLWGVARWAAIWRQLWTLLQMALLAGQPRHKAQLMLMSELTQRGLDSATAMVVLDITLVSMATIIAIMGWFLVKRKDAFTAKPTVLL